METVQNKVAVVTGAASGIGLGMTRALTGAGAHVAMLDVEDEALAKAHAQFDTANVDVRPYRCDVSDAAQVEDVAGRVRDDFGGVHLVCNNAGVGAGGPIDEAGEQDWQWVLGVNLYGVVNGMRSFVPIIKETIKDGGDGHIVNTASVMGLWTNPGGSVYGASKYAVVAISETTRAELEPFSIGVSALCPYIVDTRILQSGRNRPAKYGAPRPGDRRPLLSRHQHRRHRRTGAERHPPQQGLHLHPRQFAGSHPRTFRADPRGLRRFGVGERPVS